MTIAWVRLVQALNWIALTLSGSAVAIDAMFHTQITSGIDQLPPWAKLIGLGVWALMVHYGLRRAAKAA